MPTAERRLSERVASALDQRSFDIPLFALLITENVAKECTRRLILYLVAYGASEYDSGDESRYAFTCKRIQDHLILYGEAIDM